MKAIGGRLITLLCLALSATSPAFGQITAACAPECYGPGLASDGLANTTVGQHGNTVSYRFRSKHSGSLEKIHVYLIPDRVGYAAGNGGTIQITVNADDGTSQHNPSSVTLASYVLINPTAATPSRYFPIFAFPAPPSLVAGRLYHIVFTNVDANPSANYLSVDALYQQHPTTPSQPTVSDVDSAVLLRSQGKSWAPRKGYSPILQLDYKDGWTEGIGYMEVWIGAPQAISGTSAVRQQFTVSGAQRTVGSVAVRLARVSGTDPLKVRLQNSDGTLIEEGSIPASSFPPTGALSYSWAQYQFQSVRSLVPSRTYYLELSAPSSSLYQVFPIRKGSAYNFKDTTFFADGYAQFKQGGNWVGWTQWGVPNRTDSDLQFYFEVLAVGPKPVISNIEASTTTTSATVTWITAQASTSQVEYGTTTAYGNSSALDSTMATSHSRTITGLTPGTLYHYRVKSAPSLGSLATSSDFTFTTATLTPVITNTKAGTITSSDATITWSTDQASNTQVEYGTTAAYGSLTALDSTMVTSHSRTLSGLGAGTTYHYRVRSTNTWGNLAVSGDLIFTTVTAPPVLANIAVGNVTSSGMTITWNTDQASTSRVEYGTTTAYGSLTGIDSTMITSHSRTLSGLATGTTYHYRVHNTNAWGNQTVSGDLFATTLAVVNTQPSDSCAAGCYGPGLGADGLANTVVGGPFGNVVSYRFRANRSGALDRIHVYMLPDRAGYSAGTGGKILVSVNRDDGTATHNPSNTVLASYVLSDPVAATPSRYFPIFPFSSRPWLTAGQLYHVVFTNIHASPSTNYLSVDALYQQSPPTPAQPTIDDTDNALLLRSTGGNWAPRKGYTPILQLDYRDGIAEGIGYMEAWVGAPQPISGTRAVRETFTVSGIQRNASSVAVRVARISGTNPLKVRLEEADGTLIEQGDIPAALIPQTNSYTWVQLTFSSIRTLRPGRTYHLVLQASLPSAYQTFPIRKGVSYSFRDNFPDGYAQFKSGSSWVGWTQWGVANRTDSDLQFFFDLR